MPVIRLKGFPEVGTTQDVRRFFKKVEIPDGGVHIIGGPKELVFVTLSNDSGK